MHVWWVSTSVQSGCCGHRCTGLVSLTSAERLLVYNYFKYESDGDKSSHMYSGNDYDQISFRCNVAWIKGLLKNF